MADEVLYETLGGGIAVVTLNRPEKRNAVNGAIAQGLDAAVKRTEGDPEIRVVILASSNGRVFCAGADLSAAASGEGHSSVTADGGFGGFVYAARRKPWIAAVRGMALAGGLELALACDMIVASDDAQFGLPEAKRGLLAGAGGLHRLPRAVPQYLANEMVATGDPIDAARAYAAGLVSRLVLSEEVLDAAVALARRIIVNSPLAVQEALALVKVGAQMDDQTARLAADAAVERLRTTEDFREGPRAFVEKRTPVWVGR